jgi:ABC-type branched-subunit amino acid transport system permease subunit
MFDSIFVPLDWVGGGLLPLKVHRPGFLTGDHVFFVFSVAVLAAIGVVVILVRRGVTGKFLDALRGSETASAAVGISSARARIVAFALSAAIAGLGGGLLAMFEGQTNYAANFTPFAALFWIVIVVTIGARTVEGAVQAGIAFAVLPELLNTLGIPMEYQFILFGLGAITFAKNPDGVLEAMKRRSLTQFQRRLDRRRAKASGPAPTRPGPEPAAAAPPETAATSKRAG